MATFVVPRIIKELKIDEIGPIMKCCYRKPIGQHGVYGYWLRCQDCHTYVQTNGDNVIFNHARQLITVSRDDLDLACDRRFM